MAALAIIGVVIAGALYVMRGSHDFDGGITDLAVDLSQPDAYIATSALSRLPRDLVKAPVLREVLNEDLAFYYEEHEDRLGLRGAIKRIAFEHDTTLTDQLIELALDEPAEIAFWVDAKGAPRYWLMAMTRGPLAKSLQGLATIAANDKQLSVIDTLSIGGSQVAAYALRLSPRRTLAFLALGNRVVVLSDPGLLFGPEHKAGAAASAVVAGLLSGDAQQQSAYRRGLGLGEPGPGHTIVLDVRMLSFGYQHFFPGLKSLRFDLAAGGASIETRLRVTSADALRASMGASPWAALPADPAACVLLPADWAAVKLALKGAPPEAASAADPASASATGSSSTSAPSAASKPASAPATEPVDDTSKRNELADHLDGPAAICWYARSQLHTPILLAHLKGADADTTAALDAFARWIAPADAADSEPSAEAGVTRWQHEVTARWGSHGEGDEATYKPTLAVQNQWLTFSPDDALVDLALAAQARRYPSIADALPAASTSLAVLEPARLADLAEQETFAVIQPDQDLFRQAATQHLLPLLASLRKLPNVRAVPIRSPDAQGWVAIEWQPLVSAAGAAPVAAPAGSVAASASATRRGKARP